MLRESGLNGKLADLQEGNAFQGKAYGDAAYAILSHIDRGFRGVDLTPAQKAYNRELSAVRITVEWSFGLIVGLFPFVDFRKNLKLMLSPIGKYYAVSAILTNERAHDVVWLPDVILLWHGTTDAGAVFPSGVDSQGGRWAIFHVGGSVVGEVEFKGDVT